MARPMMYASIAFAGLLLVAACGSSSGAGDDDDDTNGTKDPDGSDDPNDPSDTDDPHFDPGDSGSTGTPQGRDPVSCEEAASTHSYVGCDYWPTITSNPVHTIFHFAAVVANTGKNEAKVTVTGPNAFNTQVTVAPGALAKIELPWVTELKGQSITGSGQPIPRPKGAIVKGGAYHLVSSSPVVVYQFSPVEYDIGGTESLTNDASLLLPSTAMTPNYRVTAMHGWFFKALLQTMADVPSSFAITATQPNTIVKVKLSNTGAIEAAGSIPASAAGSTITFTLDNAGDVAQIVGQGNKASDLSGSIVTASAPVQIITSLACLYLPEDKGNCDHIEETVMPVEALGKEYVVAPPTGFDASIAKQVVRIYGNQDGTKLTYAPQKPASCPDTINAGQVADCGISGDAFSVKGDHAFAVQTFLIGASNYDNNPDKMGDPSQTNHPSVDQFRKRYIFLAPPDYLALWADVTAPTGTSLTLDGAAVTASASPIGSTGYDVFRLDLSKSGKDGVHTLEATKPVGVQVIGYGTNTSFQYPAGLNLDLISTEIPTVN